MPRLFAIALSGLLAACQAVTPTSAPTSPTLPPAPSLSSTAAAIVTTPAPPAAVDPLTGCYFLATIDTVTVEIAIDLDASACSTLSIPNSTRTPIPPSGPADCSTTINGYQVSITNDDAAGDVCAAFADAGSPAPQDTPEPADTPVPKKLFLTFSGSGIKTSKKFSDPDFSYSQFEVVWSYDCSSGFGTGNFIVDWYDDSSDLPDGLTNELGRKGHDVTYEYNDVNGGPYHLEVNSECRWSIKVYGVPE